MAQVQTHSGHLALKLEIGDIFFIVDTKQLEDHIFYLVHDFLKLSKDPLFKTSTKNIVPKMEISTGNDQNFLPRKI